MGQHVWLLLATIITELLVITKWSQGQFPNSLPTTVKWGWATGATLLVLYPTFQVCFLDFSAAFLPVLCPCMTVDELFTQFGVPSARKYIRKNQRKVKSKGS